MNKWKIRITKRTLKNYDVCNECFEKCKESKRGDLEITISGDTLKEAIKNFNNSSLKQAKNENGYAYWFLVQPTELNQNKNIPKTPLFYEIETVEKIK